jgi:membrane-associated protease RseP (regulator of RpoE activity)
MTAPRHLWTGDWEDESSAHAEGLAARRGGPQPEPEVEPEPRAEPAVASPQRRPPRTPRTSRPLRDRIQKLRVWTRRRLRIVALAAFLTLLIAGAAYAVISDKSPARKPPQTVASSGTVAWLGVDLANVPLRGALVAKVVPGSPAALAGVKPGDLITQLDTEPIGSSATLAAALAGMQPGEKVDIQLQRGASQYTLHATLIGHPLGTP